MFTRSSLRSAWLTAVGLLGVAVALGSATSEARAGERAQRPHTSND